MADFSNQSITLSVPANSQSYEIFQFFTIEDDNVDEDGQSFTVVAEIGPDVPENISCFQIAVGYPICQGRQGAIEIKINDDDGMLF